MNHKIIMFCGLPLTGKSTLAKELTDFLNIPLIDIDDVRYKIFAHSQKTMNREQDSFQMLISYKTVNILLDYLIKSNSVAVTATFSSTKSREDIAMIANDNNAKLKVIYCETPEQHISARIKERILLKDSRSNVTQIEDYRRVRDKYKEILQPRLILDTSVPLKQCLKQVIRYINE